MRLFIADDSEIVVDRITELVSEVKGVDLIGSSQNAADALEQIKYLGPHVVILDIRMPGGNGIDILQKIRAFYPRPVVIMFTNFPYPQYRKRCEELGAEFFLDKSSDFERIPVILNKITEMNQLVN